MYIDRHITMISTCVYIEKQPIHDRTAPHHTTCGSSNYFVSCSVREVPSTYYLPLCLNLSTYIKTTSCPESFAYYSIYKSTRVNKLRTYIAYKREEKMIVGRVVIGRRRKKKPSLKVFLVSRYQIYMWQCTLHTNYVRLGVGRYLDVLYGLYTCASSFTTTTYSAHHRDAQSTITYSTHSGIISRSTTGSRNYTLRWIFYVITRRRIDENLFYICILYYLNFQQVSSTIADIVNIDFLTKDDNNHAHATIGIIDIRVC